MIQADLDLGTGKYTIGSRVSQKGAAQFNTSRSLSNVDFAGFVGIDSVQCEWFDTANKGGGKTGGKSEIMTSFLFAYCSSARAVNSGGVGGSATVSFVEGYTTPALGGTRPSFASRTAVFNLSGLPANTASSSFFGGFNCFFIRVRTATPAPNPQAAFGGGQALADGTIGWSWDFQDLSNAVPLAHTFPFMACVTSCSGVGPDGQTISDGVDQYCGAFPNSPPFGLLSTFTFGTTTTYTSINMEIREANAIAGSSSIYNPAGPAGTNPLILSKLSGTPALGQPWQVFIDCSAVDSPSAKVATTATCQLNFGAAAVPPPSSVPFANGNLLVSLSPIASATFFAPLSPGGVLAFPPGSGITLPIDLQFLNVCVRVQAFCGGGGGKGQLSNGLVDTIGSF